MLPNPIGSKITAFGAGDLKWVQEVQAEADTIKKFDESFELLTDEPLDWDDNYADYYTKTGYASYLTVKNDWAVCSSEPDDWNSNWGNYYTRERGDSGWNYIKNSDVYDSKPAFSSTEFFAAVPPTFTVDTYYKSKDE